LTDVDDPNVAAELGLNFSAKLTFASNAARSATLAADGTLGLIKAQLISRRSAVSLPDLPERNFLPLPFSPAPLAMQIIVHVVQVGKCRRRDLQAPIVAFA